MAHRALTVLGCNEKLTGHLQDGCEGSLCAGNTRFLGTSKISGSGALCSCRLVVYKNMLPLYAFTMAQQPAFYIPTDIVKVLKECSGNV